MIYPLIFFIYMYLRDVTSGTNRGTTVVPEFSDALTLFQPGWGGGQGQILPNIPEVAPEISPWLHLSIYLHCVDGHETPQLWSPFTVTEFAVLHLCSTPLFRFLDAKLAVLSYILSISFNFFLTIFTNKSAPKKKLCSFSF